MNKQQLDALLSASSITQDAYEILIKSVKNTRSKLNTVDRKAVENIVDTDGSILNMNYIFNCEGTRYVGLGKKQRIFAEHCGEMVELPSTAYGTIEKAINVVVRGYLGYNSNEEEPIGDEKAVNELV